MSDAQDGHDAQGVYDVAIVGFGPSGAVAASLLGQAGVKTYVCDKSESVYDKPRAIALDHEVMRVFQQIGVADLVQSHVEPFTPSEYFGVDGQLIRRMTMVEPPYPLGYTPSMVFTQPPVERILRAHAVGLPSVTVELGHELLSLEQDAEVATIKLRDGAGHKKTVKARYVVACDGANSTVRAQAGLTLDDLGFDEAWLVVDVLVNQNGLTKLPLTSVQYCEPDRPSTLVIGPGRHRRWEISLNEGESPVHAATPEATWKLLSRWLAPEDGELWRQASYRFHALVARDWRKDRVFLAGDAAHQQPPFLGQGMCQGIRDVANLSWKLAAVINADIKGDAAQALLDSYSEERQAHVRELTTRIKHVGELIGERNPAKARARDQRMLAECGGVVKDTPRQDMIPRLEAGCLSDEITSGRGTLFPQPKVSVATRTSQLMDQCFGNGWRLVLDAALHAPADMAAAFTTIQLGTTALHETEGVTALWMQKNACHAALVRPDNYTFGTAANSAELTQLLANWRRKMGQSAAETVSVI